jgi:branched-subunit amino acid aminotransferase/4-amino-4-deoxychorismate lyase
MPHDTMHGAIAWVDDQWGPPGALSLPLDDRGLSLGDGVFETLLLRDGTPRALDEHLQRWQAGARLLQLPPPPDAEQLRPLVAEAVARSGLRAGALRLNWSAGSGGRGLDRPTPCAGRFWFSLHPHLPGHRPLRVVVSQQLRRQAGDPLGGCKTLAYTHAVVARLEARRRGADDALVRSSDGSLCCGSSANLLLADNGGGWLTPPLSSGCLPGIMRGRCLALGLAREAVLPAELPADRPALLLNSLDCRPLQADGSDRARELFERLLASAP